MVYFFFIRLSHISLSDIINIKACLWPTLKLLQLWLHLKKYLKSIQSSYWQKNVFCIIILCWQKYWVVKQGADHFKALLTFCTFCFSYWIYFLNFSWFYCITYQHEKYSYRLGYILAYDKNMFNLKCILLKKKLDVLLKLS